MNPTEWVGTLCLSIHFPHYKKPQQLSKNAQTQIERAHLSRLQVTCLWRARSNLDQSAAYTGSCLWVTAFSNCTLLGVLSSRNTQRWPRCSTSHLSGAKVFPSTNFLTNTTFQMILWEKTDRNFQFFIKEVKTFMFVMLRFILWNRHEYKAKKKKDRSKSVYPGKGKMALTKDLCIYL